MGSRGYVSRAACGALALLLACLGACLQTGERPNVVLIVVDTLRADHLGCYGYPRPTSPNLDALAAQGVLFENAIAPSSWTGPSVASLFTSLPPGVHGMTTLDAKLLESQHTLAERFRSAGYATAGFSANFIVVNSYRGFAQGFDRFDELYRERRAAEPEDMLGRVAADAREVTDRALDWLRQPPPTPFFLYVHYMDPHAGYHPPPDYVRQVTGEHEASSSIGGATERLKRVLRGETRLGEEERLRLIDLYDGEIAFVDAELGRLLGELRGRKLLDRSIVAVLADHGEEFLEHGGLMHGLTLYRELIRVPLILRWPGAGGPARRVAEVVALIDVAPTLLDLAGVRDDRAVEGRSLAGWLRGGDEAVPAADRVAYSELDRDRHLAAEIRREPLHRAAVTGPHWSFLAGASSGRELYDLGADPLQRVDRADSEPQLTGAMQQQLDRHLLDQPRAGEVERVPLDDSEKERLRALGYLD